MTTFPVGDSFAGDFILIRIVSTVGGMRSTHANEKAGG
jgi:hypothetical protein